METRWTTEIRTTPLPEPGTLTERALAQAALVPLRPGRALRPAAYGVLALAATLPIAFFILKSINKEVPIRNEGATMAHASLTTKNKGVPVNDEVVVPKNERVLTRNEKQTTSHEGKPTIGVRQEQADELSRRPRVAIMLPDDPTVPRQHAVQAERSLALKPQTALSEAVPTNPTQDLKLSFNFQNALSASDAPKTSLVVASVQTETDGSLVLLPSPSAHPMEEILKNPTLRDYTQIRLAPAVVAALKAKGITEFVGKSVQASGKSESVLNLARPAFEVTTVTVEKAEDIAMTPPSTPTSFVVASAKPEADGSLVLTPKPDSHAMDEVRKNPRLRDYTQIKLVSSVVAALKARGITEFVGKSIQATGKSETSLYLCFPAIEVTTVTVERADDVQLGLPTDEERGGGAKRPIAGRLPSTDK